MDFTGIGWWGRGCSELLLSHQPAGVALPLLILFFGRCCLTGCRIYLLNALPLFTLGCCTSTDVSFNGFPSAG